MRVANRLWFRVGARSALTSVALWAASVTAAGVVIWGGRWEAPVLHRALAGFAAVAIAPGAVAFFSAARIASRHAPGESVVATTPAQPSARAFGPMGFAVAATLVWGAAQVAALAWLVLHHPVGELSWALPISLLTVVVSGLTGGVVGSRLRSEAGLISSAVIWVAVMLGASLTAPTLGELKLNWLLLAPEIGSASPSIDTVAPEVAARPYLAHGLYLIGIGVMCAGLMIRSIREGGRATGLVLAVAGSLVTVGGAAAILLSDRPVIGAIATECSTSSGVEVCVLAGFEPWGDEWRRLALAVADGAPPVATTTPLSIVQYPTRSQRAMVTDGTFRRVGPIERHGGDIHLGLWWNRTATREPSGAQAFGLAFAVAARSVGLPTTMDPQRAFNDGEGCHAGDQARTVVALWLAARADPALERYLRAVVQSTLPDGAPTAAGTPIVSGEYYAWYPIQLFLNEWWYAEQLLDRDDSATMTFIAARWNDLANPNVPVAMLVDGLNLTPGAPVGSGAYEGYGESCR